MSTTPSEATGTLPTLVGHRDGHLSVSFHPLTFLDEGDEVTVGRLDTDSYCVLPADGADLLRQLTQGMAPEAAAAWYAERYGEPVDIQEFLAAMDELGFVSSAAPGTIDRVGWQRTGRALFSPVAWFGYAVLLLAGLVAMLGHHDLLPHPGNVFVSSYATPVLVLAVFGQFPFVLIHEGFHALAGRRLGLRTRLRISRRLNVLVAETSLDGLVVVPRAKRYLPILAGMLADLLVIAALTLVATGLRQPGGAQPWPGAICLALAYLTLLRFLWQFYFFLQTDLYQLISTSLGCVNLHRTACQLIANRFNRWLRPGRPLHDEANWHPRDHAVARWYCWVLVAGYAISLASFMLGVLPVLVHLLGTVSSHLLHGQQLSLDSLADSLVFLVLSVAQLTAVAYLIVRERRRRSAAVHLID